MKLAEQISVRSREIKTDGYAMSIGEVLSVYKDGDIDIHPEFQRIFRWNPEQKSRLIESILLGIPIPPIFVSQRHSGIWDVIDGVQRLSTILEFMGEYKGPNKEKLPGSVLVQTEYLPDLDGVRWGSAAGEELEAEVEVEVEEEGEGEKFFTGAMRRDFKRAKLEFRIIHKDSDPNAKYDLFQRLNSGAILSPQEARNCLLVMMNLAMYRDIVDLAQDSGFLSCVPLSDRQEDQAYRQELVLRFFCQADFDGDGKELRLEYGEYVTSWMRAAAENYDTPGSPVNPNLFRSTFELLRETLGEDCFRRWDGLRHLGPFSIASFEFVTSGVAPNVSYWEGRHDALRDRIRSIWTASEFRDNSGTGVSPRRRVPRLVLNARKYFKGNDVELLG